MNKPMISVIIPVYKAERYIEHCLSTVLSQTYTNIEVICVNDGSPDRSLSVIEKVREKDNRIIIINNTNCGVSESRNIALRKSRGEYTIFVDADDWLDKEVIEVAYETLIKENADVVMWSYISEHRDSHIAKHIFSGDKVFQGDDVSTLLHRRFFGLIGDELRHPELADSLCPVWGKLYRSELINNIEFVDLKEIGTYEDGLFNIEVFERVKKAVYLDHPFYHYRRDNIYAQTAKYRPSLFEQWQHLYTLMLTIIKTNGLSDIYVNALYNRVALGVLGLGMDIEATDNTSQWKSERLKTVLSNQWYNTALQRLELKYFPVHWRAFYFLAKIGAIFPLRLMIKLIRKVINQ